MTTLERKWQMLRIESGDYLLPSNDLESVFRIRRYEDGPSFGLDPEDFPRDREYWSLSRWKGSPDAVDAKAIDNFPTGWETVAEMLATRQAAITEALRWEAMRGLGFYQRRPRERGIVSTNGHG
jgi:hypothetical protein